MIEQAKGILMERHGITADRAFDMLRDHSQRSGRKLVEVAEAVVESHLILRAQNAAGDSRRPIDGREADAVVL